MKLRTNINVGIESALCERHLLGVVSDKLVEKCPYHKRKLTVYGRTDFGEIAACCPAEECHYLVFYPDKRNKIS